MSDTRLIDPNDILAWMRESFDVDAERGIITWRSPPKNHPRMLGKEAGDSTSGYCNIRKNKRSLKRCWLIFLWVNGRWPDECLRHADGNPLNDSIGNLKEASRTDVRMSDAAIEARYGTRRGEKFGDLLFLGIAKERGDNGRVLGNFKCTCGTSVQYSLGRMLNGGRREHCGCKTDHGAHRTHGMRGTPTYTSWQAMKRRCLEPTDKDYPRWGGRGVTVHPEWINSFEAFFAHVGPRPTGTTLDRIRNGGDYVPGNVRWAKPKVQAENRNTSWFVTIDGTTYSSVQDAARALKVSDMTISRWCDGFTDNRRLHSANGGYTPPKEGCYRWRKYAA